MDIDSKIIGELKLKVEKAESHVNHLERMAGNGSLASGLDIPSINELRYAFHHLLRYLTGDANGAHDALKHVNRAIYDCYETESLYHFDNIRDFTERNSDILMKDVFPNYLMWVASFEDLREFISNTPKDSREKYYEGLENRLAKVRPFAKEAHGVNQEILKIRQAKEQQKAEKDQALIVAKRSQEIAEKNLALAEQTVRIRTRNMYIAIGACLVTCIGVVVTYMAKTAG